jgi:hypothetical protein
VRITLIFMIHRLVGLLLMGHAVASAAPPIRILAWDSEIAARPLALVCGESVVEVRDMHPEKRTPTLRLSGDGPVKIRVLDLKNAEGKPVERACDIPESVSRPLLVVMPDKADPSGLRVFVFNDDPAGFRWGSYRFLNATPKELVVQLEKKAVKVPIGWKAVDLDLGGETRGVGARVALSEAIQKPLYSAIWEYDTGIRILCFIVPSTDPRLGPVTMKAVSEDKRTLELEEKAAPKPAAATAQP